MRKIALILCFAMIAAMFGGCGSDDAYVPTGNALADATEPTESTGIAAPGGLETGDRLYTLAYYPSEGFNPYECESFNNRMLFSLIYQSLFVTDRNYNVEPMLCKSYTVSDDLTVYTIEIEEATFPDGSLLTANDVVTSLQTARDSYLYRGRFDLISEISQVNSTTVRIATYYAYENLPMLLDIPIVKASQVADPQPAGTGPYVLTNTASGLSLQLRDNWWCDAEIPLDDASIPLRAFTNAQDIRDCFEFDNLGISIADPGSASYSEYRCDYELWDSETGIFLYLACNMASGVFSNEEVRAALTYAIDREKLLEECYNGFGVTATLPASPNSPVYDHGLASSVTYDPEVFRKALQDEGMEGRSISLYVNKSDSVRLQTARLIARMLTDCGLVVTIKDNSTAYFISGLNNGDYDLYLGQTKLAPTMDLTQFFSPYGELSYGGLEDSATYAMCKEALENSGNFYNLHQMILQDGRLTPLLFRTYAVYGERGLVDHLTPARDNIFYYSLGKTMEDARTVESDTEE